MDMEDKQRLRRILNDPDLKKQSESAAAGKRKHTIGIRIKRRKQGHDRKDGGNHQSI